MEDEEIVQMYWDRDEKAISATSEKYGAYSMAIARHIVESPEDAEECVNEVYLKLWNSIPPHRPDLLAAYIGKIVRNVAFNRYKKNRAQKRGGSQMMIALEELAEEIGSNNLEEEWDQHMLTEVINSFLSELPEHKRKLFVRRYWYGDSVRELAKTVGMTENHVSVILKRLRTKLRNYLIERGYGQ